MNLHLGEFGGCPACDFGHSQLGELFLQLIELLEQLLLLLGTKIAASNLRLKTVK
jgi:hypothetical protein